ncbi:uncharacterized protein (TIGR00255 family) [Brevibacillus aydinogluensis]|uniref:YicC/YloC family endoribonuclease n=1 Tax=Brevibacillus aydinogluensis TaxID=927786 RepID=UPI00289311DD|nr:YicC/YloC family endoribonuclease [Brevibacillus aydinogluensis]MDT3414761.1 uncharacterized protein (TIGR00255 family) [Brevibacillus aydinogluensis]
MVRSMTGYGRSVGMYGSLQLTVEIRAVNHRFCEILVRLPKTWGMLEEPVRKLVGQFVRRGRVDVAVTVDAGGLTGQGIAIDWAVAEHYVSAAQEMNERFSLHTPLTAKDLLLLPGVVQTRDAAEADAEQASEWLLAACREAAEDLLSMKRKEGLKLQADLEQRLARISVWTEEIGQMAPLVFDEYRSRLHQRMAEWAETAPFELDAQRLAQEAAFLAERSDISEEVTRLTSHCSQFAELLGREEAVGRKLDFLLQEMNREANTIASKANHLPIQRLAVEIKTELEKMREQVQNIE